MTHATPTILTGELPATPTYRRRSWVWAAGAAPGTGTLVIRTDFRRGDRVESSAFAVAEEPLVGGMGRAFRLAPAADPTARAYRVVVGPHGSACTCKAGTRRPGRSECKHRAAVGQLLAAGGLPPTGGPP